MNKFRDTTIVLGVTGGIACAKASSLASALTKAGADVHVVMTKAACEFVSELTFRTITGNDVSVDMFAKPEEWNVKHISLAQRADLFIIAPATANFIGKVANGIADDLLTTTVMATKVPVIIAGAMNDNMYTNPIVAANIEKLKGLGYYFCGPESGVLACKTEGIGRMSEPEQILNYAYHVSIGKDRSSLAGKRVLITSGPTYEPLDPVRYIANRSSGKMGYALAYAALVRGASVCVVTGPTSLIDPPQEIELVKVESANQMCLAVEDKAKEADIIIGAAAVADYRPAEYASEKLKKDENDYVLELTKNPDILATVSEESTSADKVIVGFAAETSDILLNASLKVKNKGLDFIVANGVKEESPFGSDYNAVTLIFANGRNSFIEKTYKELIAHKILDACVDEIAKKVN